MGMYDWDFTWGSNAIVANQAMMLLDGHRIDSTSGYLDAAIANMDYLLGKTLLINPLFQELAQTTLETYTTVNLVLTTSTNQCQDFWLEVPIPGQVTD